MCHAARRTALATCAAFALAALFAALWLTPPASAQKRPKRALSEGDARRAVASAPGFALKTSAVRVKDISAAGTQPVTVLAEVTTAVRFRQVEDERTAGENVVGEGGGAESVGAGKGWRAVEFRTGDRNWEELDWLAGALGVETLEGARGALEGAAREFESRRRETGKKEEVTRGPVRLKDFSPLLSSAVAEVAVEATFRLERGPDRKWRVAEVTVGGVPSGVLEALIASVNRAKAGRALNELETVRAALEAFRRERGFYVVGEEQTVLIDHLSPRHLPRVLRLDPWGRPYRYAGTRETFRLSSDGPDGKPATPDDVTVGG